MAIKTFYLTNAVPGGPYFGQMQDGGTVPTGVASGCGWTVGTTALTTPFWKSKCIGTRGTVASATSQIDSTSGPFQGSSSSNGGDAFVSPTPVNGLFAAGNWTLSFGFRVNNPGTHAGRIRCRVWAGGDSSGANARELTSGALVGSTTPLNVVSTTFTSSVTWNAPAIQLYDEYLFFQLEWNSTAVGGSVANDLVFYQSAGTITTTDLSGVGTHILNADPRLYRLGRYLTPSGNPPDNYNLNFGVLHMDGQDGGTTFLEHTIGSLDPFNIWTSNGAIISANDSKFGGVSLYANGSTWIDCPPNFTSGGLHNFNSNWTIGFHFKPTAGDGTARYIMGTANNTGANATFSVFLDNNNKLNVRFVPNTGFGFSNTITSTSTFLANVGWNHVNISDAYSLADKWHSIGLQINGVTENSISNWTANLNHLNPKKFAIGRLGEYTLNPYIGYIDEFWRYPATVSSILPNFPVYGFNYSTGDFPQVKLSKGKAFTANMGYYAITNKVIVSPTNMTSDNTPPYQVTVSSSLGAGYEGYLAFDGTSSFCHSSTPLPWWIKIDLSSSQLVGYYKLTSRFDGIFHEWIDWILEGSNDNSNWTLCDTVVGEAGWTPGQTRSYECDFWGTYRFWRWTVTKSTSGSAIAGTGYAEAAALELYSPVVSTAILRTSHSLIAATGTYVYNSSAFVGNDQYTKALLHFDVDFTDSAKPSRIWSGSPSLLTTYKFGPASALFSGSNWLDTPVTTDFDVGSQDWTFDCWLNVGAGSDGTTRYIFGTSTPSATGRAIEIYITNTNVLRALISTDVSNYPVVGTTFVWALTGWHHVEMSRSGGMVRIFLDGVQDASVAISGSVNNSVAKYSIGRLGELAGSGWVGYLDEVRFSKGIARHTSNFTPPTIPYAAPLGIAALQYNHNVPADRVNYSLFLNGIDRYTKALLHMENNWLDTTKLRTWTPSPANFSSGTVKFGTFSGYFSGSGYVWTPPSSDFNVGTEDWTFDCWFYVNAGDGTTRYLFGTSDTTGSASSRSIELWLTTLNKLGGTVTLANYTAINLTGTTNITAGAPANPGWHHAELSSQTGTLRLFLNGVLEASNTGGSVNNNTRNYAIGRLGERASNYHIGYVDELRFSKGIARHTSNFTPPTLAYSGPDAVTFLSGKSLLANQGSYSIVTDYSQLNLVNLLSCTRASTAYGTTSAGTLVSFPNNTLRITDLGLLIEEARTNLLIWSQDFSHVSWSKSSITVTVDAVAAPDGTMTADSISDGTDNATHYLMRPTVSPVTNGSVYSYSVYAKAGTGSPWLQLYGGFGTNSTANFDVKNGVLGLKTANVISSKIEPLANGWYRCTMVFTAGATSGTCYILTLPADQISLNYTGSSSIWHLWGAQIELGSSATSYIPTTSATVTRAQDVVTAIGQLNTILGVRPHTVMMDAIAPSFAGGSAYLISEGNFTYLHAGTAINQVSSQLPGVLTATLGNSLNWTMGVKAAYAADGSGRSVVGGGGTVSSDTNTTGILGTASLGSLNWNSYIRRFDIWNSRLSDSTLQGLTTPGANPSGYKLDLNFTTNAYLGPSAPSTILKRSIYSVAAATGTYGSPTISDNFNRADGALGSNWLSSLIYSNPDFPASITSNQVVSPGGNYATHIWQAQGVPNDQYAEVQIISGVSGPIVRHDNNSLTAYWLFRSSSTLYLYKLVNTSSLPLTSAIGVVSPTGPLTLRLEVIGNTLKCYADGVLKITFTDNTNPVVSSGQPGFQTNGTLDNFNAGAINGIATFQYNHRSLEANGAYGITGSTSVYRLGKAVLANRGIHSLTGPSTLLKAIRVSLMSNENYAITGQPATLRSVRKTYAANSVYSTAGKTVTFYRNYVVTVPFGIYTMTGKSGTNILPAIRTNYVLSGKDAITKIGYRILSDKGTYGFSGQNVTSRQTYALAAVKGSYLLTGIVILRAIRKLYALHTFYGYTSITIVLRSQRKTYHAQGNYLLFGRPATLRTAHILYPTVRSFTLIPNSAILREGYKLPAVNGSYAVTGKDTTLRLNHRFKVVGVYAVNGQSLSLTAKRTVYLNKGTYTQTGRITLRKLMMAATKGSYTIAGNAIVIGRRIELRPTVALYNLSGRANSFQVRHRIILANGTYTQNRNAANLRSSYRILADRGNYGVVGNAVTLRVTHKLYANKGNYNYSGKNTGRVITVDRRNFVLTGKAATLAKRSRLLVLSQPFTITGNPIVLRSRRFAYANHRVFLLTGRVVTLGRGYHTNVDYGILRLIGKPVSFRRKYALKVSQGTYGINKPDTLLIKRSAFSGGYGVVGTPVTFIRSHKRLKMGSTLESGTPIAAAKQTIPLKRYAKLIDY